MIARLLRFAWVGILATLVHAGVYSALHHLGVDVFAANVIAFATAFPVSYLGQRRFVFRSAGGSPARLLAVQLGGLALNSAWVWLARALGLPPDAALVGMVGITPALAYAAAGRWVFKPAAHPPPAPACPRP